jgi:hypothetical protein
MNPLWFYFLCPKEISMKEYTNRRGSAPVSALNLGRFPTGCVPLRELPYKVFYLREFS